MIKKIFIAIVIIVVIVGGGIWYAYYRYIPKIVGQAIVENKEPAVLPAPYKQKIQTIKKPVNRATEKIIREMDSLDIPFAAILRLVDNTGNEAVITTYNELKAEDPKTPNEIFDIIKRNIPSEEFDLERFRKPFLKYATMDRYRYGMRYIENNDVIEQIEDVPYRQIVKEVLTQKRAEIDRRLKNSDGPALN